MSSLPSRARLHLWPFLKWIPWPMCSLDVIQCVRAHLKSASAVPCLHNAMCYHCDGEAQAVRGGPRGKLSYPTALDHSNKIPITRATCWLPWHFQLSTGRVKGDRTCSLGTWLMEVVVTQLFSAPSPVTNPSKLSIILTSQIQESSLSLHLSWLVQRSCCIHSASPVIL